jgi:hypothetical protein
VLLSLSFSTSAFERRLRTCPILDRSMSGLYQNHLSVPWSGTRYMDVALKFNMLQYAPGSMRRGGCPLLAQSGHVAHAHECLLSGVKRTSRMMANGPTLRHRPRRLRSARPAQEPKKPFQKVLMPRLRSALLNRAFSGPRSTTKATEFLATCRVFSSMAIRSGYGRYI